MGSRGPVGKRSEQRQRRNKPSVAVAKASVGSDFYMESPFKGNPDWCLTVSQLWDSFSVSGQARFFEPSDWAFARLVLDELDEYVCSERKNGQILSGLLSALTGLLVTEGDRRRVGVELSRGGEGDEAVTAQVESMEKWKARFA